jgi:type III secretion protein C
MITEPNTTSSRTTSPRLQLRQSFHAAVAMSALAVLITCATAAAAPLVLPDTSYNYTVVDQDLPAALQEFGTNLGIKVNVSPEVRGRIQGRLPDLRPRAFLDRLAAMFNLEWYYDGQVLYISSVKEAQTRLLVLAPIGFEQFKTALNVLKVADERFGVMPAPGNGLVLVSGPPRFVALTEQTLAGLIAEAQAKPRPGVQSPPKETVLNVFRGAHVSIWRNGRLEQLVGPDPRIVERPESEVPHQSRDDDAAGRGSRSSTSPQL